MTKYWIDAETSVELADIADPGIAAFTVDDKQVAVRAGQTIHEALSSMEGIGNIPTLCYNSKVRPYGACRLCTVEVSEDGGENFKFVAACLYPARNGIVVKTDTERVRSLRKGIIELLLARSPNARRIQALAEEYGVTKPRFSLGDNDCILCGLCTRACQQLIGKSAISLVNRGIYKEVAAPFYAYELEEGCLGCGDCAYVCPTGAIKLGENGKPVLPKVKISYAELETVSSAKK